MKFNGLSLISLCLLMATASADVPQAVKDSLKKADDSIAKIVAVPDKERTFKNTLGALDDINAVIDDETAIPVFMENVAIDPKDRADARDADEYVSNWQTALGKREDLYRAIKAYADTKPKLTGEEARFLAFTMRDYHRAGMDLPRAQRQKLLQIELQMNTLGIQFSKNIADDDTHIAIKATEFKGTPSDVLAGLKKQGDSLLVGMDTPTVEPILDYCDNEATRKAVWFAFKRRGGEKNVKVLQQLLRLRYQEAHMLGYKSAADYTLEPRMAKNAATVAKFYADLRPIVRKKTVVDYKQFTQAKRAHTGDRHATPYPWDQSFYKALLMRQKYAVDGRKISEYFPMQQVVDGLFNVTQSLYGLKYKEVTADAGSLGLKLWDPDVKLYEVDDVASGKMLGHFIIDLFPRPGKYSHAACWALKPHKTFMNGMEQPALAALVCNFTKPTPDKPSLLPHDEVVTFFHEFGHCLHNLLSEAKLERFAGAQVALDFVEAPSQMFENWVWNAAVLQTFARHYKTGQPFPKAMLDGMLKAQYLGSGLEAEHQFYYGIVDQKYHTAPRGICDTTKVGIDTVGQVELYKGQPGTYFEASFTHFVGYEAAYYGYMWSLVYAQDMFQRFQQLGLMSPAAGMYYRKKILAHGGSVDEMTMLKDYLGRAPRLEPFLRHLGL